MENALLNLAINARDAMPKGGKLTIETRNVGAEELASDDDEDIGDGDLVLVSVEDTGSGMSPSVLARVFDPFFTTKEVGRGSGLGLSMVYGFVKQSNGHVRIDTEVGRGTTIHLYFPMTTALAHQRIEPGGDEQEPSGNGELILVVEDEEPVRALAVAFLNRFGYRTVEAGSVAEALEVMRVATPDLVLTDVVLPGGRSGPDLAREVGTQGSPPRFLFMSGYPERELESGSLDQEAALLSKPFTRQELAAEVRAVLHPEAE